MDMINKSYLHTAGFAIAHRQTEQATDANPVARITDKRILEIRNPYSNDLISTISCATRNEVLDSIALADSYDFRLTAWQRYEILTNFCLQLKKRAREISLLISKESGKTLTDSNVEVNRALQAFLLSAEEAKRINGEVLPVDAVAGMEKGIAMVLREPIGIVCAITPFNFPLNLVAHKAAPALAANNPVIIKPSESTPLTALTMQEMLLVAGAPAEMIQVLVGDPVEISNVLVTDERVKKVSFTGSAEVGKSLCRLAGMKSICMELGGNDPMIILKDADLDAALPAAIDGAFGTNGQRCTSVKRFIIEQPIADQFINRFVEEAGKLKVGNQLDPETYIGPLINSEAARSIEHRIKKAVKAGAQLLHGGKRDGALLWPTVLDHVTMSNPIVAVETFGPVAPFIRVNSFDEAISTANDTGYGLQSGIFTNNMELAKSAMTRIQAGAVMINKAPGFRAEHLPFGGIKDSGLGKEGIKYAVDSMTRQKTIVL